MQIGRAPRIVVLSPDPAFEHQLVTGLSAMACAVDVQRGLDALGAGEPPAALCVIHLEGECARVLEAGGSGVNLGCPVIAVLPRGDVAAAVEVLRSSERVAGVIDADRFDPQQLAALATRIVSDDVFGLVQAMAPGTAIHARSVADHAEASRCVALISELAEQRGLPRGCREPIAQCVDEMLINALYDAPVDAQGRPLFQGVSPRARIALRSEHSAAVQYACDGQRFAVSVRDVFGTLERQTVLRYLHKGAHAEPPIDRKVEGAGLGLYLMVHAATAVFFHVLPGIATEVLCLFDVDAPRRAFAQLGFLTQRDAGGLRASGPAHRRLAGHRRRARALVAAAAVGAGVIAALILSRPGRGAAGSPPPATLELDSQPTGATVAIDGHAVGSTPLTLTSLAPGATVTAVFQRTGYRAAAVQIRVPGRGERVQRIQPLEASDDFVRVRFVSTPPGAEIRRTGQPAAVDRTYTPAEMFVEAGQVQRFTLVMPGHVPLVIEPFTPARGAQILEKGGALVAGATLHVEATLPGEIAISGAPHCTGVALPVDCALAPGRYALAYQGPDHARITRTVTMAGEDVFEKLELGIIAAAPGKVLQPGGVERAVVEAGSHVVTVSGPTGAHEATVVVAPGATVVAN
jgi:hypothetical protein